MTAAALIAEARRRAGLSQAELARRLGTHQPVVARWESGGTEPDFATVTRVLRAAGFELTVGMAMADDHDLALIRRELGLSPHRRLANLVAAVHRIEAMVQASHG